MSEIYLNIGCGKQLFDGFINIDMDETADLQHDVTKGLPFDDCSVSGIYSEHFIEHINQAQGHAFMRECARVLKPGGKVRIATPDLDAIVTRYSTDEWMGSGMKRHGYTWVDNPCEMLNINMREWGHQWVYNETELTRLGRMNGLRLQGRMALNDSTDPMLGNRETRPESLLILEFEKPDRQLATHAEPLVSVLIAAYNPRYFSQSLRSAMEQTYRNLEIIISDDCPSDAIEKIVQEMAAGDSRVQYSKRENREIPRGNYLRLVGLAQGEFIKFLNDDDLLELNCIEQMLNAFRATRDISLVTSNRSLIDASGQEIRAPELTDFVAHDQVIKGNTLIGFLCAMEVNYVGEPTTFLFRREDIAHIRPNHLSFGGELMAGIGDVALASNLLAMGDVYFYKKPYSHFRQHEEQHQRKDAIRDLALASWKRYKMHVKRLGFECGSVDHMSLMWRMPDDYFWQSRTLKKVQALTMEESYDLWREKHFIRESDVNVLVKRMVEQWGYQPSIHLVVCTENGEQAQLADTIDSISQQVYTIWGLTVLSPETQPNEAFSSASNVEWLQVEGSSYSYLNQVAQSSSTDWIVVMHAGDTLEPTTLLRFADRASLFPRQFFFYCDEDSRMPDGGYGCPEFKPQFSLDLLRSTPFVGGFCMVRREMLAAVGGYSELPGVTNHDLALKFYEQLTDSAFVHIADVLFHRRATLEQSDNERQVLDYNTLQVLNAHLQRSQVDAQATMGYGHRSYRVQYKCSGESLISIVIQVRNHTDYLKKCLKSLIANTAYKHFELLLCCSEKDEDELAGYAKELAGSCGRPVRFCTTLDTGFDSAALNRAIAQCQGEYILTLADDANIIQAEWLDVLLGHAMRAEVGAVGARILHYDMTLNHAGMIMGMSGLVGYPGFATSHEESQAFQGRDKLEQNFCAVSGACLMVSKAHYEAVGGFNEKELKTDYYDVDFCIRLLQAGYINVYTPFSNVVRAASQSEIDKDMVQLNAERDYMLERWLPLLADDPYYNENLALRQTEVVADSQIPMRWERVIHDRKRIVGVPLTDTAVGDLRVIAPLNAMDNTGLVQTMRTPSLERSADSVTELPTVIEMARLNPDVLLLQSATHGYQIDEIERYRKYLKDTFMVYDLEDYKLALPEGHPQSKVFPVDMRERLQRSLNQCDRLLVSAEQLVEDYRGMIEDIRYVPNYLSRRRWEGHNSQRRFGQKPRVGWAGAHQHHTDLAIIVPAVTELADEVEWVFMGMCPDELKPYISEFHPAVSYTAYPERLASLNLDLALAPLENNIFNRAKSNLRLLEFGVMGWPVVCTDIEPYRCASAPVKRVENTTEAWVNAIRERIHDLDATAAEGDRLREWVLSNYMLEDNIQSYMKALFPE